MLPLGHEVSSLLAVVDVARRQLYTVIDRINQLDKENSERAFREFRQTLKAVNDQVAQLTRDAKQYDREFTESTKE